jgi:pilus assembly protein Flp/PilA
MMDAACPVVAARFYFLSLCRGEPFMIKLRSIAKSFFSRKDEGATMVEYALMLVLIAAVCVATITSIGTTANYAFSTILTNF